MSGTAKHAETANAQAGCRWVLLQAWPEPALIPLPVQAPLGREYLLQFGVEDEMASTEHCELTVTTDGLAIDDLDSTNGTWVNGARIRQVTAREGAVLRVGHSVFVLRRSSLRTAQAPISGASSADLIAPFGLHAIRGAIDDLMRTHPANVLITGETGTGKKVLARHIALCLERAEPFEPVSCAAYRTESFGAAEGGSLFLDELGDIPLEHQPVLLRFLEDRRVRRAGTGQTTNADLLVLAATNHDLEADVQAGSFLADLLACFGVPHLHLPPLRERREDIPAIAQHLGKRAGWQLDECADINGIERLMLLPLEHNVRQLRAVLEEAYAYGGVTGEIIDELYPTPSARLDVDRIVDAVRVCGSEEKAAEVLGISRHQVREALAAGSTAAGPGPRA